MKSRLAVLALTHRGSRSEQRQALLEAMQESEAGLLSASHADGVVRIETCARVEWIVSARDAKWCTDLLEGSLSSRAAGLRLEHYVGSAAADHLCALTLGLDSPLAGEDAIGAQVLAAFQRAQEAGRTDVLLRRIWNHLSRLGRSKRRARHGQTGGAGIEALVRDLLSVKNARSQNVAIFGRGPMGRALVTAFQDAERVESYGRDRLPAFLDHAAHADVVCVASGGAAGWLDLPPRSDAPVVVDVSAEAQIGRCPGWQNVVLDEVIALAPKHHTIASGLEVLQALRKSGAAEINRVLEDRSSCVALSALEAEKKRLFEDRLPALFATYDPDPRLQRALRAELSHFAHRLALGAKATDETDE